MMAGMGPIPILSTTVLSDWNSRNIVLCLFITYFITEDPACISHSYWHQIHTCGHYPWHMRETCHKHFSRPNREWAFLGTFVITPKLIRHKLDNTHVRYTWYSWSLGTSSSEESDSPLPPRWTSGQNSGLVFIVTRWFSNCVALEFGLYPDLMCFSNTDKVCLTLRVLKRTPIRCLFRTLTR